MPSTATLLFERLCQRERSRLINEAVQYYIEQKTLADLRKQLKEGAIRRAERDLKLAEESFYLEEEAWQKNEK